MAEAYRIGEAAKTLGVRVETLRRWEREGKLTMERTPGRPARIPALRGRTAPVQTQRSAADRRGERPQRFPASNQIKRDKLFATVEIQAGPHRVLAFITREAVDQLGLTVGMEAVATVKATSVMVNLAE